MKIITAIHTQQQYSRSYRSRNKSIGLVPTMGALHDGHRSLIRKARKECDIVIVSIFVNPTQFSPQEDLSRYPRPWNADRALCRSEDVDCIFHPTRSSMYGYGTDTIVSNTVLSKPLCGKSRPTHFQGVLSVVAKLFNATIPDRAYFGQKDYQQYLLIKAMIQQLNFPLKIIRCPIVREKDGLALSSRNRFLSPDERHDAALLYTGLSAGKKLIQNGTRTPKRITPAIQSIILQGTTLTAKSIDYIECLDAATLTPINRIDHTVILAAAVRFSSARLIDNILVSPPQR